MPPGVGHGCPGPCPPEEGGHLSVTHWGRAASRTPGAADACSCKASWTTSPSEDGAHSPPLNFVLRRNGPGCPRPAPP